MSDSWRIQVRELDRSRTILTTVGTTGAAVIRAAKGPEKPVLISTGDSQRILDIFGAPSVTYPDVMEAIEYNNEGAIWLSAPYATNAQFGGVMVTKAGSVALPAYPGVDLTTEGYGITDTSTYSVAAIKAAEQFGVTDGLETAFTHTTNFGVGKYVNQSVELIIDHNGTIEVVDLTPTDAEPEALSGTITGGAAGTVSGTFTRATGDLSLTFTNAPLDTDTLYLGFTSNYSADAYFTLFAASPRTDDQRVTVTRDADSGLFTIALEMKNYRGIWRSVEDFEVAIEPNTFNGFGVNVYLETVLENNDYLIAVDHSLTYDTFSDDSTAVAFAGGSRGDTVTLSELTTGWNYFQKKNTYPADIFMDFSADAGIPALFNTLRSTYQKYKSYILPLPIPSGGTPVADAISTKSGYSINNRGLAFYWNWGRVREPYNNTTFYTPLIGRVGVKYAQMADIFNGLAPSWVDENSHGGQISGLSTIIELSEDPSETELQQLDTAGINPIIFHPVYGVMIVSQRTAQSPGTLSDGSWIGHSRLFDYIISNTVEQILVYQITKLNDEVHRQLATALGEQLIAPIVGANLLRDAIPKCDRENNNDTVLANRQFVFTWGIQVTPFSETIILNFVTVNQTTTVDEVI